MSITKQACLPLLLFLLVLALPAPAEDNEPLKGGVKKSGVVPSKHRSVPPVEPLPAPVLPGKANPQTDKLRGSAGREALSGWIEDESKKELEPRSARIDPNSGRLKGQATLHDRTFGGPEDPDLDDQQLMVEWDRWRNRFLHAIQSGMQESLNNPQAANIRWDPQTQTMRSRFPLGTVAWFSCQVTPDRRVINVEIKRSSGYPGYDQAILNAIHDLDGASILRYPKRSRRKIVNQVAGIRTARQAEYRHFKFGDVERIRVPGGQY